MKDQGTKAIILSLISLAIGLIAILTPEYRIPIIAITLIAIALYYISEIQLKIDQHSQEIKKLHEKIKIYQDIVELKGKVKNLEARNFSKKR